jgi:hypothetical protein
MRKKNVSKIEVFGNFRHSGKPALPEKENTRFKRFL